jgi:hypothetical protein
MHAVDEVKQQCHHNEEDQCESDYPTVHGSAQACSITMSLIT